ncbi:thyroid peroxidase isoform X2 [Phyllopteryx taeniolatus]|uniref:thyroid peroxidase isoform X2 n=1 Tax=Phyllopteryx taeniolatus TaxID=161469 RepID=UPI002AD544F9|nr:thyroid peroxidase isoform X2 [Phyllopteryx taeniolatus]
MGKTADLTTAQKTIIDTLHRMATSIKKLIISSFQESRLLDEKAFQTRQRRSSPVTSIRGFTFHRQTETETQEIGHAAEVFQSTLQELHKKLKQRYKRDITETGLLSWEHVELIAELSGCPPPVHPAICQYSHLSKYRSISGMCNNRYNHLWGAANIPLVRWLPPHYEDGVRQPKGWNRGRLYNGFQLPMPKEVSRNIMESAIKCKDDTYSHMLVEWGQYIDHDITLTPQSPGKPGDDCLNTCKNMYPCFPIQEHDILSSTQTCMPFNRSLPACFNSFGPDISQALQQQQMNAISSFIDGSVVYGSCPKVNHFLRDLCGLNGKLTVNDHFKDSKGRPYLPFKESLQSACLHSEENLACFCAGDSRVNEGLPLASLHMLWLRQHNQIAETLKHVNGHWNAETIYEETRKIIGALHQIITMRDYVPKVIGKECFDNYIGPYGGYDPTVDPSASNVFATAAFRFGHATISAIVRRLNESYQEHECFPSLLLHDTFFSPWRIIKEGGIDPILRGAIGTEAAAIRSNKLLANELTQRLVVLAIPQQMDLASLNLQRGRDHGLPGYNDWRDFCGMERIGTLEDFKQVVSDASVAEKILQLYKHPDNIDVWLGGLVETFLTGSRTGPVFACLIAKQMKALRDGDRFWWEADGVFSQPQKDELRKVSLSKIICDNTDITEVPPDAFIFGKYPSGYISCDNLPAMNLEAWREEKSEDLRRCGSPGQIKNGDYELLSTSGKLVALYSCYHGFKLTGDALIACEGNQWSNKLPDCEDV